MAPVNAIAADPSGRPQSEGPRRQGSSVAVAVPDTLILDLHVSRLIHRGRAGRRSEAQVGACSHLLHGRRSDDELRAWEPQRRRKRWRGRARLKARAWNWSTWRCLLLCRDQGPSLIVCKTNIAGDAGIFYPTEVAFRPDRGRGLAHTSRWASSYQSSGYFASVLDRQRDVSEIRSHGIIATGSLFRSRRTPSGLATRVSAIFFYSCPRLLLASAVRRCPARNRPQTSGHFRPARSKPGLANWRYHRAN